MLSDLRYSARGLARTPGLTAALFLTIALGVGGNTMVYGFIRGTLQRPTVVGEPERVVSIVTNDLQTSFMPLSAAQTQDLMSRAAVFESAAAVRERHGEASFDGATVSAVIGEATPSLFPLLQIRSKPPSQGEAVISRRMWIDVLGAAKGVAGKTLNVDGQPLRIAGVAPEEFDGLYNGRPIDVWTPVDLSALTEIDRSGRAFWTVARLRPGVTLARAKSAVTAALGDRAGAMVLPYTGVEPKVAGGVSQVTAALPAAALIVFLIACANLATFLLSRAVSRSHETSVRVAIGATRQRISRQLMIDALLVSLAGAAAGATISLWSSRVVPALFFAQDAEQLSFAPGIASVAIACAVCVTITVLCGLLPLTEVRDDDPASVLRRETGGLSNRARRARMVLVIAQMSACCFLLISAGLLLAGFRVALKTSLGNRLGDPVIATMTWSKGFARENGGDEFYELAQRTARQTPGVTSAQWTSAIPGGEPSWQPLRIEPQPTAMHDVSWRADVFPPEPMVKFTVTPRAGRMLGGRDRAGSCPVVMLNDAAAALIDGDPVGRSIVDPTGHAFEIVGVASVAPKTQPGSAPAAARPVVFYYREQAPPPVTPGTITNFRIPVFGEPDRRISLDSSIVDPGYFGTVGAKVTSGEALPADLHGGGCRVAVVNVEAEERFFGGHAVGRWLLTPSRERIGIVGVVKTPPLRVAQAATEPAIFHPMAQDFTNRMTLVIGTKGPVEPVLENLRSRLAAIDGQREAPRVVTLDEHLSMTSLASARITATLFAVCALLAVALSAMGVYGAMSDAVYQRRRELALRAALGAQGWRLTRQVLWEGAQLSAGGAAVGALGAAALQRWGLPALPGASVWTTWVVAPILLAVVVLASSWLPARRAATADPLMLMKDV